MVDIQLCPEVIVVLMTFWCGNPNVYLINQ